MTRNSDLTRYSGHALRVLALTTVPLFVLVPSSVAQDAAKVANKVAYVMCGGSITPGTLVTEQYLLDLEREGFLSLCGEKKTQERIAYTLKTGRPLRN